MRLDMDLSGTSGAGATSAPSLRKSVLIVDDDRLAVSRLVRGLESRGFEIDVVTSLSEAVDAIRRAPPDCLVVETRLPGGNGLEIVSELARIKPEARSLVLTGYGNIATAVAAIKRGACDYLPKPADLEDVCAALVGESRSEAPRPEMLMSADRVRWEHIQRVFELCDRNVSETARRLNMHRRTLQRILAKRAPR